MKIKLTLVRPGSAPTVDVAVMTATAASLANPRRGGVAA